MEIKEKRVRSFLNKKIQQLNDIVADLDGLAVEIGQDFYRTCIFGSARIKSDSGYYKQVEELAFQLASRGCDIVTGGGPGLMEAANYGAKKANSKSKSFGLSIQLPFEPDDNSHLDVKYHHRRFSSRLDEFMRMSHSVIITPGGIGTLLELFYAWQLIQVNHITPRPVILLGREMWGGLLDWIKEAPLKDRLIDLKDFENLTVVDTIEEVVEILEPEIKKFYENRK